MLALIIGSLLAVAAVAYVLYPLIANASEAAHSAAIAGNAVSGPPSSDGAPFSAIDALREIEFDRATGKLSDDDYAALKAEYTPRALEELRARETEANAPAHESASAAASPSTPPRASANPPRASASPAVDPAEALISAVKAQGLACPACGTRPEPDALFCSNCGRELVALTGASRTQAR